MISLGAVIIVLSGDFRFLLRHAAKGLFRHEILFASGATVLIEFREFAFRRKQAETEKALEAEQISY
jgi:hypothetical protein